MSDRASTRRFWPELPLWVALVVLWMLLWGELSVLALLSGVVVAVLVTRVFYLPPVELSGRFNPFWFLVFLLRFARDLVVASVQVSWLAVRGVRRNAIIAVTLHTRSDLIVTLTSIVVSLLPGSLVIEVDRHSSTLYVHTLGAASAADIERVRAETLATERGLLRALGSREELRRLGR